MKYETQRNYNRKIDNMDSLTDCWNNDEIEEVEVFEKLLNDQKNNLIVIDVDDIILFT